MESNKKIRVEIAVYDPQRNILPNAKVTLIPLEKANEIIYLHYDESEKLYKTNDINFENYKLKVESNNFRTEEREVKVDPIEGLKDIFIMSKEGQSFYYRGNVKIPFEPRNDLIAVAMSTKSNITADTGFAEYANNLDLEDIPVSKSILKSGVRVFKIKPGITANLMDNRVRVEEELTKNPSIKVVGPIIQMNDDSISFLTNEIVVKLKGDINNQEEISSIVNQYNLEISRTIPSLNNNIFILRTKTHANYNILNICDQIVQSGKVEYAEPNMYSTVVEDSVIPSDFLFTQQWHISISTVSSAWSILNNINPDITFGSSDIIIAVIDSGIDVNHPDFNGHISNGNPKIYKLYDFDNMLPNNDSINVTLEDHGTCCAGVAAGCTNNPSEISGENEGIAGAAGNCRIIGIRYPSGDESTYAAAYLWAAGFDPTGSVSDIPIPSIPGFPAPINPGADIITSSFGVFSDLPISGLMKDTFDFITTKGRNEKGTLLFFSTGNGNTDFTLQRPWASYNKTFAVAASSLDDDSTTEIHATYSNYGGIGVIDICAPSHDEYVQRLPIHNPPINYAITTATIRGRGNLPGHTNGSNDYKNSFGGTSSATPLAAGIAALVLTANSDLKWTEVREIIRDTALKIDSNNTNPIGRWKDINDNTSSDPNYLGPYYSRWYGYGRIDAAAAVRMALNR